MAVQITKIEKALSLGKTVGATKLLQEYYSAQDKAEFYAGLQAEYDAMYPAMRGMTIEEQLAYDEANFDEFNPKPEDTEEFTFEYPQVEIEYITTDEDGIEVRTPAEYVTYSEYINETRVVTEAIEATYDADGTELTPAVAEVTEMVRPYIQPDTQARIDDYMLSKYADLRKNEYPKMEEFMDAWVKDDTIAIDEYKQKCLAVKAKYPKGV